MTTTKKTTTKAKTKAQTKAKAEKETKEIKQEFTKEIVHVPTDEELITGEKTTVETITIIDVFNKERVYTIQNLQLMNHPTYFNGDRIKDFFTSNDEMQLLELQKGAKSVILQANDKDLYKIEVVE